MKFRQPDMKYTQLSAFEKHLQNGAARFPPPLYLLIGKEDFSRRKALEALLKTYGDLSSSSAVKTLEGDHPAIFEELGALSLFSKRSILVLNAIEKWSKPTQKHVEKVLASPNTSQLLILNGTALNKNTTLYKRCETIGVLLEVPEEKPWEKEKSLAAWLIQAAQNLGKQCDPIAAQLLVKQLGVDQALLEQELFKLVCYVGERRRIEIADVATICGTLPTQTAWQLADALIKGDLAAAWPIANQLLLDPQQLLPLLRALRSQWQNGLQMTSLHQQGVSPEHIQRHFPNLSPSLIHRQLQQFIPYGMRRFKLGLLAIDSAESAAKNSGGDEQKILERLLFNLIPQRL